MEIDDEANCGTDLDADTAKSTSSTHDSASLVITTNNSPTMMVNNTESSLPKAHLIILAETRL